jgi:hypothetical protein
MGEVAVLVVVVGGGRFPPVQPFEADAESFG